MSQVSVGQACANAIAAFLRTQLSEDVTVFDRWPEANVQLPPRGVSVVKVGRRRRLDVMQALAIVTRTNETATIAQVGLYLGSFEQPIQIDVWETSDDGRDDLIAQLDDAFTQGVEQTLLPPGQDPIAAGVTGDPVRDGILVPLVAADGYAGNVDCLFDEPDIDDDDKGVQRDEYRATYRGSATGTFYRVRLVPRLVAPTLKLKPHEGASDYPGQKYDTYTLETNPSPPPATKTTYGQST